MAFFRYPVVPYLRVFRMCDVAVWQNAVFIVCIVPWFDEHYSIEVCVCATISGNIAKIEHVAKCSLGLDFNTIFRCYFRQNNHSCVKSQWQGHRIFSAALCNFPGVRNYAIGIVETDEQVQHLRQRTESCSCRIYSAGTVQHPLLLVH